MRLAQVKEAIQGQLDRHGPVYLGFVPLVVGGATVRQIERAARELIEEGKAERDPLDWQTIRPVTR